MRWDWCWHCRSYCHRLMTTATPRRWSARAESTWSWLFCRPLLGVPLLNWCDYYYYCHRPLLDSYDGGGVLAVAGCAACQLLVLMMRVPVRRVGQLVRWWWKHTVHKATSSNSQPEVRGDMYGSLGRGRRDTADPVTCFHSRRRRQWANWRF